MVDLFDELDRRLAERPARVSIYVVGGSALLLAHGRDIATPDVDIARSSVTIHEVALELAQERGLRKDWLNASAGGWVPAHPDCACLPATRTGLTVHLAPASHLLAMKVLALRAKDEEDLVDLLDICDLAHASSTEIADVLYEVYSGEDELANHLGIPHSDPEATRVEVLRRAELVLNLVN